MKPNFLTLIAFLSFAPLLFASCNNDDETPEDRSKAIEGGYAGTLTVSVASRTIEGTVYPAIEEKYESAMSITSAGNNLVNIHIADFKYPIEGELTKVGDFTVRNIRLTRSPSGADVLNRQETDHNFTAPIGFREVASNGYVQPDGTVRYELGIIGSAPLDTRAGTPGIEVVFEGKKLN